MYRLRRQARRKGLLLRKSRSRTSAAEAYGLYVLVQDCAWEPPSRCAGPVVCVRGGEGTTLAQISAELDHLPDWV